MARFGRRFPVPWHQPKAPQGLFSAQAAPSVSFTMSAAGTIALSATMEGSLALAMLAASNYAPSPLSSLPTIDIYVAFNPTKGGTTLTSANTQALPVSGASNAYWTNIANYNRQFHAKSGKQHYLDRVEASTLALTVNNRLGYFLNGTSAGNNTGYIMAPRLPIAITATKGMTTYPIYCGLVDSAEDRVSDAVNVEMLIQCSDLLKYLSLKYMNNAHFWEGFCQSASVANWFPCSAANTAIVTYASCSGTTATYTAINTLAAGDTITVTGLGINIAGSNGKALNITDKVVETVITTAGVQTGFTVDVSAGYAGAESLGTGSVVRAVSLDQVGTSKAYFIGPAAYPVNGAIIYDANGCVDLANGGSKGTAYIRGPVYNSTMGALDFWVLGQGLAGTQGLYRTIATIASGSLLFLLQCDPNGSLVAYIPTVGTVSSNVKINDGFWHHIGVCDDAAGNLQLYVDGKFTSLSSIGTPSGWFAPGNLVIGELASQDSIGGTAMYVDEIVVSNTSSLSTLKTEVLNRYVAGTLLQKPTNSTQTPVSSGDRIAEILTLAGFGTVANGALTLNANTFYINDSLWPGYSSGNGTQNVEPYYWDTPITSSTALDLILQIVDTDVGIFFQKPDGTLNFYNQAYFGSWSWKTITAISASGSAWTFTCPNSFSAGQTVTIVGCAPLAYNGTFTIATASSTQFTITSAATPGTGNVFGNAGVWTVNTYTPISPYVWTDDDSGAAYEGSTLSVVRDDADTWTLVKITPQAGIEQVYENFAAEARYGQSTLTKSATVPASLNAALSSAVYFGYLFNSPLPRVSNVTLLSQTGNGANVVAMLGSTIFQVVEFKRTAPNASTSGAYPTVRGQIDQNMVIESKEIEFDADLGLLRASFILDPYPVRA